VIKIGIGFTSAEGAAYIKFWGITYYGLSGLCVMLFYGRVAHGFWMQLRWVGRWMGCIAKALRSSAEGAVYTSTGCSPVIKMTLVLKRWRRGIHKFVGDYAPSALENTVTCFYDGWHPSQTYYGLSGLCVMQFYGRCNSIACIPE